MPAINLPRLKIQTAKLMESFNEPDRFLSELHDLFELYADRTFRAGAIVSPVSVLPSYRVPLPVIRHLELELGARTRNDYEGGMALADRLWDEGNYESRTLAAYLLGCVPPFGEEYLERLSGWVVETRDPLLSTKLLSSSLTRMRTESPDEFLTLMGRWEQMPHKIMWSSVMVALVPLLEDKNFHNLPSVLNVIQPIIEAAPATMQKELSELIHTLYESSPIEATYFLRHLISASQKPHTKQNIRRILPSLPDKLQTELREELRK